MALTGLEDDQPVFYIPSEPGIIDRVNPEGRSWISGETLEEVRKRYPGAEVGLLGGVCAKSDDMFRRPPTVITRKDWQYALEQLPPEDWCRSHFEYENSIVRCESFKMMERTIGNITSVYVAVGRMSYHLATDYFAKHEDLVALCRPLWEAAYELEKAAK